MSKGEKMKTVAVFFGGVTPEHDISIITAISSIIKPLALAKQFNVIPVYISKKGVWYSDPAFNDVAVFRTGKIDEFCAKLKPVSVNFNGKFSIEHAGLRRKVVPIDIAFPAMHGGNGEDGSLMGLLRMANIPFVGCDMQASVIAMDKVLAKQVAEASKIPVAKYQQVSGANFVHDSQKILDSIEKTLDYPFFVKPAHLGSSIGISRAANREELNNAIEVAAYYDEKIIVEEAVKNLIEVTVPIMGDDDPVAAMVERPLMDGDATFDFDTKYMSGGGKKTGGAKQGAQGYSEIPANIPKKLYDESLQTALRVYRAVECAGIARVDLLIDSKAEVVYFNELNPLPGSLYAHNWRQAGMSNLELVTRLIELAEERFEKKQKLQKTFTTNFLKQF